MSLIIKITKNITNYLNNNLGEKYYFSCKYINKIHMYKRIVLDNGMPAIKLIGKLEIERSDSIKNEFALILNENNQINKPSIRFKETEEGNLEFIKFIEM